MTDDQLRLSKKELLMKYPLAEEQIRKIRIHPEKITRLLTLNQFLSSCSCFPS